MGYLQARETERRQQRPAQYAKEAKQDAQRACLDIKPVDLFECVYEKVEASREQTQAEQDLSAQQRAAFSGLASAVISAVTLLVSGFGLWALLKTIRQGDAALVAANDANATARRIGEAQVRCYLSVPECSFESTSFGPHIVIHVANSGQSPARKFRWIPQSSVKCGADGHFAETPDTPSIKTGIDVPQGDSLVLNKTRLTDSFEETAHGIMIRTGNPHIRVKIRAVWEDVFGNEYSETFGFHASPTGDMIRDGAIKLYRDTMA